ncbi:hypothetical protein [Amycolatopsis sp. NPDC051102]|uniref:hypothetical protein n=1 Tax=Amycolatopsis sp. NPDC051102 TaxID=3155163 RepID=UPI003412A40C
MAVAGGVAAGGVVVWAVLRFGLLAWLGDKGSNARPVVEALSWLAGIGGLLVGVAALVIAVRQGRATAADASAAEPVPSQSASNQGVIITGGVSGNSGSGPTVGVNFGQVGGAPPDPPPPARG